MLIRIAPTRFRRPNNTSFRVRRGHPLAGGLVACIVTGGQYGVGRDLITGAAFTGTNSPVPTMTQEGPATDFSGTAYAEAPHDPSWNVLGAVTVLWRGVIRTPTVGGFLVGKVPSGGAGATNTPFALEYNNPTSAAPAWIRSNATGGDPYKLWAGSASSITADRPQTIAVSTDGTITTTPSIYVNGALLTTTFIYGFGGGAPTGNSDPLRIGRRQDGATQQNGLTSLVLIAALQWTAGQHALAHLSPYSVLEEAPRYYFTTSSGASYTLALAHASFALTGQAAALRTARQLAAGQGSFALTGQAAALRAARRVAAGQGAFALTGQDTILRAARRVAAGQGSFTLTGQAAALRAARKLALGQGSFALTGYEVAFSYSGGAYTLTLDAGVFALTGQTVGLRAGRRLALSRGSFALTGQSVVLLADVLSYQSGFVVMSVTATIGRVVLVGEGPAAQIVNVTEQQSRT